MFKVQIKVGLKRFAKSHLTISNKWADVVRCYGLTQNPSNGNYMLVMIKMDIDLRKYLQQKHNQLTWKARMKIIDEITLALYYIHLEKAIHRDLHSGNILYSQLNDYWYISDLGFCGPADKSSTKEQEVFHSKSYDFSIPNNINDFNKSNEQNSSKSSKVITIFRDSNKKLSKLFKKLQIKSNNDEKEKTQKYVDAPEVIVGREYTFASDIYSIAILMWEISSGQPPFINYEHENDIVMNIINGIRPKIVPGTPLEYKNLMKECWDADPLKRPDAYALMKKKEKINLDYQNMSDELFKSEMDNLEMNKVEENYMSSRLFTSKIHNFGNLPEPRNATEEEQEVFHSKLYDFNIPNNIIDFNKSNEQNSSKSSKIITIFRDSNKKLSKSFKKLQINSNNDDEVYNNPNFHSKEQDKLEIPDGKLLK
ncbi:kinase-like protein [Rhizophagus irregularis]|uniref:Kinase-like protein n=1 Tax=Rhizophagus irregularis TaxID=588596 RepID=A0A2N0R4V2_9GLOM|nr:kinase-like protein [Rhizophagus irregularis]